MKLIISDDINESKIIENPTHIPRVGERVRWLYNPPPVVRDVIYDFYNDTIHIRIQEIIDNGMF